MRRFSLPTQPRGFFLPAVLRRFSLMTGISSPRDARVVFAISERLRLHLHKRRVHSAARRRRVNSELATRLSRPPFSRSPVLFFLPCLLVFCFAPIQYLPTAVLKCNCLSSSSATATVVVCSSSPYFLRGLCFVCHTRTFAACETCLMCGGRRLSGVGKLKENAPTPFGDTRFYTALRFIPQYFSEFAACAFFTVRLSVSLSAR